MKIRYSSLNLILCDKSNIITSGSRIQDGQRLLLHIEVPSCILEVTFFLALSEDILGVFGFFDKKRCVVAGIKKILSRASYKKTLIKLTVESPDKSDA